MKASCNQQADSTPQGFDWFQGVGGNCNAVVDHSPGRDSGARDTHEYKRDNYLDPSGRSLRMGAGGATPLVGNFYGYGTVQQGMDDKLYVTVYDVASNMPQETFSVSPQ